MKFFIFIYTKQTKQSTVFEFDTWPLHLYTSEGITKSQIKT